MAPCAIPVTTPHSKSQPDGTTFSSSRNMVSLPLSLCTCSTFFLETTPHPHSHHSDSSSTVTYPRKSSIILLFLVGCYSMLPHQPLFTIMYRQNSVPMLSSIYINATACLLISKRLQSSSNILKDIEQGLQHRSPGHIKMLVT